MTDPERSRTKMERMRGGSKGRAPRSPPRACGATAHAMPSARLCDAWLGRVKQRQAAVGEFPLQAVEWCADLPR